MDLLARVEGEGRFTLIVEDGVVREARLAIFEAPRYFEAFLRHRSVLDVPDMVARVCGICPVAYQMSAVNALERGVTPEIRSLRRLMYCGEWIQSHALHVFVLHAPDFLGYRSVIEMAADHRAVVERGLRLRRAGDRIVEVLGGRAIHPVSVRVGGFTAVPPELGALRAELAPALGEAIDATRWAAGLPCPAFEQDYVFVALGGEVYPLEGGDVVWVSGRAPVPLGDWASAFVERQVPYSTALQCHLADGTPYLCGPLARWHHHRDRIHPTARSLAEELAIDEVRNPYRSIVVRCLEIVHALAEALDLCDAYAPMAPFVETPPRVGVGFGASEAPRGLLWHRYDVRADGTVEAARIVPPTSQNQARIEADLADLGPELLAMPHDAATLRCEQLIRAYDPCISCATHFLDLAVVREPGAPPCG